MGNLVDWLKERQKERRMSDGQFADMLGIDRATWNLLKNGRREPGIRVIRAAVRSFPDCRETIVSLAASVTMHNSGDTAVKIPA